MKTMFSAVVVSVDDDKVHNLGVFDNLPIAERGVSAFLFGQIDKTEWHQNNTAVLPPIHPGAFLEATSTTYPIATAIWSDTDNNWHYKNFLLTVSEIPVMVNDNDIYDFMNGNTAKKVVK